MIFVFLNRLNVLQNIVPFAGFHLAISDRYTGKEPRVFAAPIG